MFCIADGKWQRTAVLVPCIFFFAKGGQYEWIKSVSMLFWISVVGGTVWVES